MTVTKHPVHDIDDLADVWRAIDGGFGYSVPQLFATFFDREGYPTPILINLTESELGDRPDDQLVGILVERFAFVIDEHEPGGSVAVMRARPGRPGLTRDDRMWCQLLHRHLSAAPFDTWPIFFATDDSVGPVPPDDLIPD